MKDERGLTLIEMLISLTIIGLVTLAISSALIGVLTLTDETQDRFAENHDAQMSSAYFVNDAASATTVELGAAVSYGPCGASSGTANVVSLLWPEFATNDPAAAPTLFVASYVSSTVEGQPQLDRQLCRKAPDETAYSRSDTSQIAHLLREVSASCMPSDCSCPPAGCAVEIQMTDRSGFSWSLAGARRVRSS